MERYFKHIRKNTLNFTELRKRFYVISVYGDSIRLQGLLEGYNVDGWTYDSKNGLHDKTFYHNGHKIKITLTN